MGGPLRGRRSALFFFDGSMVFGNADGPSLLQCRAGPWSVPAWASTKVEPYPEEKASDDWCPRPTTTARICLRSDLFAFGCGRSLLLVEIVWRVGRLHVTG